MRRRQHRTGRHRQPVRDTGREGCDRATRSIRGRPLGNLCDIGSRPKLALYREYRHPVYHLHMYILYIAYRLVAATRAPDAGVVPRGVGLDGARCETYLRERRENECVLSYGSVMAKLSPSTRASMYPCSQAAFQKQPASQASSLPLSARLSLSVSFLNRSSLSHPFPHSPFARTFAFRRKR